ncbi:peptidylprolyl isomerase [Candidatus Woesearchaeota archaeon]|nr:peptidylprolyl isomerase [Candidatus Woesearchaeota archaeon]
MSIQKNEFIELEYMGKADGAVFDTTDKEVAKKEGIASNKAEYGPMLVCVGQGHVLKGLDDALIGKEIDKAFTITLQPEEAFGKKSAKLVRLIPLRKFKEHDITPFPGLQVDIDNMMGTVKTASGGRVLVDFNHPLSGRVVTYEAKIVKKVEDDAEKVKGYLKLILGFDAKVDIKEGKATAELPFEVPKEVNEEMTKKLKELIPNIKEIAFIKKEEKQAEDKTPPIIKE